MDMITGKGPSARHEIFYFAESTLGAVRIDDYKYSFTQQPGGWLGETVHPEVLTIVTLRLDPFERTIWYEWNSGSFQYWDWYKYQFWRFVFVQEEVAKLAMKKIQPQ
jgi:hypothetical protein